MKKKIQKPFNAEAAKRGAKIETRSGDFVRIICYDRKSSCPILALVLDGKVEICLPYNLDGSLGFDGSTVIDGRDLVIVEEVEVSKFNPGDWLFIKNGGGHPWLITAVTPNWYEMQNTQGDKDNVSRTTVDNYFRLWTLKDAKPGNILSTNDGRPFIFKGFSYSYDNAPIAYCGIDIAHSIVIDTSRRWTNDSGRPATYEEQQRLFNKLKEEGYKWDARERILWKKCN